MFIPVNPIVLNMKLSLSGSSMNGFINVMERLGLTNKEKMKKERKLTERKEERKDILQ